MQKPEIIFFDVDGTLTGSGTNVLSPATVQALKAAREQGILLFLCTGRSPSMLPELYRVLPFDGWACFNGQLCLSRGRYVRRVPIARGCVEELVGALSVMDLPAIFLECEETYCSREDPVTRDFMVNLHLPAPEPLGLQRALRGELYQCLAFAPPEREEELHRLAPDVALTRWSPLFVDVIASGGGKDRGMRAILEDLGIPPERAMAIGDGGNDIPMLLLAGTGIAMGNADAAVQAAADYVTGSLEEDGVARALSHFGLATSL